MRPRVVGNAFSSKQVRHRQQQMLPRVIIITIIIGIAGGLLGGYIGTTLGLGTVTGLNIPSLLLAIGGAVILLFAYRLIRK